MGQKKSAVTTRVQHRVLNALAKSRGSLSRKRLAEKAFNGNSVNLKKVLDPLVSRGLVASKELDIDGKVEISFEVTPAGQQEAKNPPAASASHKSLPKIGGTFEKVYKGKTIVVSVVADGFKVGQKTFSSLSATAKHVRGLDQEVNGWLFFGLVKPKKEEKKTQ